MLTTRELSYGLYGAWRFIRLDTGAMRFFDVSVDGFWKSFQVAWLVLPIALLEAAFRYGLTGLPQDAGLVGMVIVEASAYVMSWVAFPLLMSMVSDLLQRGERYIGFVVVLNWAKLPIWIVNTVATLTIVTSGGTAAQTVRIVAAIAFFATCFYLWFIARTALQISGWAAGAVVILFYVVEGMIQHFALGLLS